ncbi:hypothetical protein [Pseudomonas alloputida]|uniref:hypothetical protein n=1 Tax=Pseudomonas alloputida TaxID=1940621 RepID=UPI00386F127D
MPTENRSSNTEMVSVPPYIGLEPLVGRYYPAQCRRCGWVGSSEELTEDDAQCTRDIGDRLCLGDCDELERHDLLNIIQAMATPQPHPEPIAWMVGTAIWWTKEEAERDAAAVGLPIVGLGPMTDRTATELAESETMAAIAELAECEAMADMVAEREWAEHVGTGDVSSKVEAAFTQLHNDLHEAGEKLAERDTLLRDNSGKLIRMAAHLISAPLFALQDLQDEDKKMSRARVDKAVDTADARLKDAAYELRRIADALSASAGPSSPTWSCQACQVEQPTDRACDACGDKTELAGAKS